MTNLILNIPHASSFIPQEDFYKAFLPRVSASCFAEAIRNHEKNQRLNAEKSEKIQKELLVMTDWYTDELFNHGLGKAIIAPVSRLVCDTERFSHDENESMAQRGMGYCYRNGSENQEIKSFSQDYQDEILWRYYAPHHIALTDAVSDSLSDSGRTLILDCHSFSSDPLPYEPEQSTDRPDICIGTDDYHTPKELASLVEQFFKVRGYSVAFNSPYAGTIVPLKYYHKDKKVQSLMIEVNRKLYLTSGTNGKSPMFKTIQKDLFDLEVLLREETA